MQEISLYGEMQRPHGIRTCIVSHAWRQGEQRNAAAQREQRHQAHIVSRSPRGQRLAASGGRGLTTQRGRTSTIDLSDERLDYSFAPGFAATDAIADAT